MVCCVWSDVVVAVEGEGEDDGCVDAVDWALRILAISFSRLKIFHLPDSTHDTICSSVSSTVFIVFEAWEDDGD